MHLTKPNRYSEVHPALVYFAGLLACYGAIILLNPRPPLLQDYPTWVYEGVAIARSLRGHADPQFRWKHFPVPNLLSDTGLGFFCTFMDWRWAAKIWLCLYLVLSFFACYQFSSLFNDSRSRVYWMVPTIAVVNLCFWWGFLNFQFSVVLMLLFFYFLYRERPSRAATGILLTLVFFSHAISFAVCLLALVVHSVAHRTYRRLLVAAPSALFVLWYVYGRFVSIGNPESGILTDAPVPYFSRAFVLYKLNSFFKSLGYVNPRIGDASVGLARFGPGVIYLLLATVAVLGLTLMYLMLQAARASFQERGTERLVWVTIGLVFAAAVCCPSRTLGISDPGSRFMVCALTLAVMMLRPAVRFSGVACVLSVVLGVAGLAAFASLSLEPESIRVSKSPVRPALSGFAHVDPDSRAYYYQALRNGAMDRPVFGTSLLYNRKSSLMAHGVEPVAGNSLRAVQRR